MCIISAAAAAAAAMGLIHCLQRCRLYDKLLMQLLVHCDKSKIMADGFTKYLDKKRSYT